MTRTILIVAALALAAALPAAPANAQAARTFVSAMGSDNNNCANVATPCRHFAAAYAVTAPAGEIFVLDPANYGSLTITHAVSIEGHGWASIAPPDTGNAITINANAGDNISIDGVSMNGAGAAAPTNGIVFNSGGSLTVTNCTVQNFALGVGFNTGNGILMQPSSGTFKFTIANTTASNNGFVGVYYLPASGSPSATGAIDHVVANNNGGSGISVYTAQASGGTTVVTISNSLASNNGSNGIWIESAGAPITAAIDNVTASGNETGVVAIGVGFNTANVLLGRSVITGNDFGVTNGTSPSTFYTYKDNRINLNLTDGTASLNPMFSQQ